MNKLNLFGRIRWWVVTISMTVVTGLFYGVLLGIVVKKFLLPDLSENEYWIFIVLPVGTAVAWFFWSRIPTIFGLVPKQ